MAGRAAASVAPEWVLPAPPARRSPLAQDTGAVTVEAALALCALTVFLTLALGALIAVAQALRCADAARELARLAARGEPDRGRAVAARLAPSDARMELVQDGETVTALVSVRIVGPLPLTVDGRAVAALEGVGAP
jgi:hypothetical protein